jgi:hypothetical protein
MRWQQSGRGAGISLAKIAKTAKVGIENFDVVGESQN